MTIDLEDRVRATLQQQARDIEVGPPNPTGVFERVHERRIRRRTTRTIVGVVAVAVIGFGFAHRNSTSTVQTGHANQPTETASQPAAAVLGHPAMITLDGWTVEYMAVVGSYAEYRFTDGNRTLQVSFYPLAERTGTGTNPTEVALRGTTGITTDEGAPRYRVDWDEQGQIWEADGEPFADVGEFLSVLGQVRIIDEAAWKASLPDGVGTSILANSDKGITWYDDKGISCFGPQDSVPCN